MNPSLHISFRGSAVQVMVLLSLCIVCNKLLIEIISDFGPPRHPCMPMTCHRLTRNNVIVSQLATNQYFILCTLLFPVPSIHSNPAYPCPSSRPTGAMGGHVEGDGAKAIFTGIGVFLNICTCISLIVGLTYNDLQFLGCEGCFGKS